MRRLFRYFRQRLLERREGHQFLYRLTEKGRYRGMLVQKRYESIHEYLTRPNAGRLNRLVFLKEILEFHNEVALLGKLFFTLDLLGE